MDLTLTDVSKLLKVPESTLLDWTKEGEVPSYKLNDEYRYNREEVEEWMLRNLNQDDLKIDLHEQSTGVMQFNFYRALHKGFVLKDVEGNTKEEVISSCMDVIAEKLDLDAETVTQLLLEREKMMTTALNRGVALPHTREFLLSEIYDVIVVAYPKEPIEYDALDGQKVHTLFFLFACQDKRHLNLLGKIAYFCHDSENLGLLKNKTDKPELLAAIRSWESKLSQLQPA